MLFGILLTAQIIICAVMGGLILIQRSEGGALGMGGGPSGFMSARGAGNLLTKLTWIFGALLFANSIGMTVIGNLDARGTSVIDQLGNKLPAAPLAPTAAAPAAAASSTSSAPSLTDLPGVATSGTQSSSSANGLSALPLPAAAPASQAAPAAPPKMPKALNTTAPAHAAAHLPSNISTSSVSLAPLGAKSSHSAAPNIFATSSAPATSQASPAPASAPAPAGTPASSQ